MTGPMLHWEPVTERGQATAELVVEAGSGCSVGPAEWPEGVWEWWSWGPLFPNLIGKASSEMEAKLAAERFILEHFRAVAWPDAGTTGRA